MGKGNSIYMVRELKNTLDSQYREWNTQFQIHWYNLDEKYYIAHVKIPSRSAKKLYYDVLIEFDIDSIPKNTSIINKGKARVFSNCPSFTYTFAYVFNQNGDMIDWCKSLYPKEIFQKHPLKRNPYELYGYERSLYLAIKHILSGGRNYTKKIHDELIKVKSKNDILKQVASIDTISAEYKKKINEQKGKLPKDDKKPTTKEKPNTTPKKKSSSKTTNTVKTTKTVKNTKKTKTTKKTKKI